MNKKEKIALLNGIIAGTRSISELQPLQVKHWHKHGEVYQLEGTSHSLAEKEFTAMDEKSGSNIFNIVHVHSEIPIAESEDEVKL